MGVDFQFPRDPDWTWLKATYPGDMLLRTDWPFISAARSVATHLAYLATPYSREVVNGDGNWNIAQSLEVEIRTARWARIFAIEGVCAVSPILQACAILRADPEHHIDPLDDLFWSRWCQPMLSACRSVVIPPMAGWDISRGVWREACWALMHNRSVYLIAPGSEFDRCAPFPGGQG